MGAVFAARAPAESRPRTSRVRRLNCQIRYRIPSAATRRQTRRAGPWPTLYNVVAISLGAPAVLDADVVASAPEVRVAEDVASTCSDQRWVAAVQRKMTITQRSRRRACGPRLRSMATYAPTIALTFSAAVAASAA